jgi:muramoyltetrapeptide carboxypeptidase
MPLDAAFFGFDTFRSKHTQPVKIPVSCSLFPIFANMIRPALLQPGDTIAIVSPAKSIEAAHIDYARGFFQEKGLNVLTGTHAYGQHNYFSGTDEQRTADFQHALDNPEVKAIICARGGYGCVRITEQVRWACLMREPKWIVGFSDVTVLHQQALRLGVESIHATMPLNYRENTPEAMESLWQSLTTASIHHEWQGSSHNKTGEAAGMLVGGNLSIVYSLLATSLSPVFDSSILFIEDVGEQLYHLDRMLQTMKLAGILDRISGLIVGGMTDMRETAVPTGWSVEQLVLDQFRFRKIPIAFNAPIGHINDNRAVICGAEATLTVSKSGVRLIQ